MQNDALVHCLKSLLTGIENEPMALITAVREIMLNIVDRLVPELQRRGRYRTGYAGRTLRENLAA